MRQRWFRAKTYGWGWYPATWQGWAVLAFYVLGMVLSFYRIDSASPSTSDTLIDFVPRFVLATLVLLGVCWLSGEKPRWRWGNK